MEVKFVSYDGKYPNLCRGSLTVEIDGKKVTFGNVEEVDFPEFWSSGGKCRISRDDEIIEKEPWTMECANKKDYPRDIWLALPRVLEVMNENVPYGCCGGCL